MDLLRTYLIQNISNKFVFTPEHLSVLKRLKSYNCPIVFCENLYNEYKKENLKKILNDLNSTGSILYYEEENGKKKKKIYKKKKKKNEN